MEEKVELESLPIPISPVGDLLSRVLEVGDGKEETAENFLRGYAREFPLEEDKVQRSPITLDIREVDGTLEYSFRLKPKKKGAEPIRFKIRLQNAKLLDSESCVAAKIWQFITAKILQGGFSVKQGRFTCSEVHFSLTELVSLEIFRSVDSARKYINRALEKIQCVLVKMNLGVNGESEIYHLPLISGWRHKGSHWTVFLDSRIRLWALVLSSYAQLPVRAFRLKGQAFALARYLARLAFLNRGKISEDGRFVVGFRSIAERLLMVQDTNRKTQLIVKPVAHLLRKVNEADCGFHISLPTGKENKSWLDSKLNVSVGSGLITKTSSKGGSE